MVSRTKQDIEDVLLLRGGKKYLVTWRYFSKGALESSLLTIKNFERIRVLYAKYGGEKSGRSELKYSFSDIIGSSRAMEALKNKAARFANTDFPVLIQGESGTGKELLAQAVHQASQRKNGPFIAFNCAALAVHFWKASYLDTRRELSQEPVKKAGLGFLRWQVEELYSWMKSEIFL